MTKNNLDRFNIALQCNPKQCQKERCPNYNTGEKRCDAYKLGDLISTLLYLKFEEMIPKDEK